MSSTTGDSMNSALDLMTSAANQAEISEENLLSTQTLTCDLQFPVEIWRLILEEACNPITEEEMSFEMMATETQTFHTIREPDRQFMLSLSFISRTFTKIVFPFLYRYIFIPMQDPASTLYATLKLPLPEAFGKEHRSYGDLVRFLIIGDPSFAVEILKNSSNVSHLIIHDRPQIRRITDLGSTLEKLKSLVSLRMTESLFGSLRTQSDEATPSKPTLQNLRALSLKITTDDPHVLKICSWALPSLQSIVIRCPFFTRDERVDGSTLLNVHGHALRSLSFDGDLSLSIPKAPTLESSCPLLTHLLVTTPDHLLEGIADGTQTIIHRGVTTVTITDMTWESCIFADGCYGDDDIEALRDLRTKFLPSLQEIHCPWAPYNYSGLEPCLRRSGQWSKFQPWFLEVLEEWEGSGIKFIRTDTNELISFEASTS
ncbi:hypothetical protein SISNIDRAFT_491581 [Sistotremastrum niveocremeum HHB9708]|uniref:F-box domain-containing protein n=1 Tax=Sistotremastrum niveocremeum HHB9708 TaxID=1314777 RepID=A0A164MMA1_9AGAM|nr:hypothetical protein SISNIDRAFT_491581 [Sistotremastrum niveocremeum HHB9708]